MMHLRLSKRSSVLAQLCMLHYISLFMMNLLTCYSSMSHSHLHELFYQTHDVSCEPVTHQVRVCKLYDHSNHHLPLFSIRWSANSHCTEPCTSYGSESVSERVTCVIRSWVEEEEEVKEEEEEETEEEEEEEETTACVPLWLQFY